MSYKEGAMYQAFVRAGIAFAAATERFRGAMYQAFVRAGLVPATGDRRRREADQARNTPRSQGAGHPGGSNDRPSNAGWPNRHPHAGASVAPGRSDRKGTDEAKEACRDNVTPLSKPSGRPRPFSMFAGERGQEAEPPSDARRQGESREEVWQRLSERLDGLVGAIERQAQTHTAHVTASSASIDALDRRLSRAAEWDRVLHPARREILVVLGIDFGTTSTKIVGRLPYEAGSPGFAVPVPEFACADGHAYLWASRLWLRSDGVFSLCLEPNAALTCALKTNLMTSGGNDPVVVRHSNGLAATAEQAATAFLALQLRQAKGWFATEKAALFGSGRPAWSYNFGFPAASLNDVPLRARYERCIAAAIALSDQGQDITVSAVREALASVKGNAADCLRRHHAAIHPEIAAAVAGFANSMRREDGLYALVDVGGGTVDCCTFTLFADQTGSMRCPILAAKVELLGVEPWRLCEPDEACAKDFRWLLDTLQNEVIWRTKKDRDPASPRWTTELPVFFVGGGVASPLHRESVKGRDRWLRERTSGRAGVRLETLPGAMVEHPLCKASDAHRLAVAIGLSYPSDEIPEVQLPDEIEGVAPATRAEIDTRHIGKEQV